MSLFLIIALLIGIVLISLPVTFRAESKTRNDNIISAESKHLQKDKIKAA
ncbi:MAG: hypothetical protein ACYTFY_00550 [Planctomycetota bacterium]